MITLNVSQAQIVKEVSRGIELLATEFGRPPNEREMNLLLWAVIRRHMSPNAPTTRLQ